MRVAAAGIGALAMIAGAARATAPDLSVPRVDPGESVLSEYVPAAPPDPNPPPYTLLRYNERYDYLADPRNRGDVFDLVKYIPLDRDDPESYLSFGGELRERYDNTTHAGLGSGGNTALMLQRVTLGADLHVNARVRVFAQGLSGLQFTQRADASPVNQNPLDLQQGFADYVFGTPTVAGPRLTARAGRFEMSYGSARLVATRAATNVPFKFDGLQFIGGRGDARLYAFLVRPAQEQRYHLDGENDDQTFWGVYASLPTTRRFPAKVDAYYLGLRDAQAHYAAGTAAELRHSLGFRWYGSLQGWSYDWEPVLQFGNFGNREIFAWTLATDTSYRFAGPWQPRLGLRADVASGDSGKATARFGAFNPLYFKAGYFNDASVIRPTNIADLHPWLQAAVSKSLTLTVASDVLWRYSVNDGVYAPSGRLELGAVPGSRYIGCTAEGALQWKLARHVSGALSYVHLAVGDSLRRGGGQDVDYLGSWVTFTW